VRKIADRVDEAFYALFPRMRPSSERVTYTPCPKCTADKACRAHRISAADLRDWDRRTNSPSARAGASSGRTAAEGVVIRETAGRASRLDRGGHEIEG
jgi:hypothetical protein